MTPLLTATTLLITVIVVYVMACWVLPFGKCVHCSGGGTRKTITGRLKPCRRCRGSGLRLRIGRRVFNYFAHLQRDAARAARTKETR